MDEAQLGAFSQFWDGEHPHHLPLLNLRQAGMSKDWNLRISLARLEDLFNSHPREQLVQDMEGLLTTLGWRPQLIFCFALLKLKPSERKPLIELLWKEIEVYNSWILPQLVVTASLVDPAFATKASNILTKRSPTTDISQLDEQELMLELSRGDSKFEDKSYIALAWQENLLRLIEEGKVEFVDG